MLAAVAGLAEGAGRACGGWDRIRLGEPGPGGAAYRPAGGGGGAGPPPPPPISSLSSLTVSSSVALSSVYASLSPSLSPSLFSIYLPLSLCYKAKEAPCGLHGASLLSSAARAESGRMSERVNVRERSIADVPSPLLGRRALL